MILSIIIPCFHHEQELGRLLADLKAQVLSKEDYEIIIVITGNKSEQLDLPENATVIANLIDGPAAARNAGARTARGEFLLFLDADQRIEVNFLLRAVENIKQHPDLPAVKLNMTAPKNGGIWSKINDAFYQASLMTLDGFCPLTPPFIITKELFMRYHGFDEQLITAEDTDLGWRIYRDGTKITFEPHLSVEHYNEKDLIATLRQQYNFGWGWLDLKRKWKDFPMLLPDNILNVLLIIIKLFLSPVKKTIKVRNILWLPLFYLFYLTNMAGFLTHYYLGKKQ